MIRVSNMSFSLEKIIIPNREHMTWLTIDWVSLELIDNFKNLKYKIHDGIVLCKWIVAL